MVRMGGESNDRSDGIERQKVFCFSLCQAANVIRERTSQPNLESIAASYFSGQSRHTFTTAVLQVL